MIWCKGEKKGGGGSPSWSNFDIGRNRFSATGGLRVPKFPTQLKGFAGTVLHTAQWDSSVDFTGKRVGLVGNGAR